LYAASALAEALVSPAGFAWEVWLLYLAGAVILAAVLVTGFKENMLRERALNRIIALGPVFLAVPFAVFGAEHFTDAKFIAQIVPAWIPGHMFWTFFVGACLVSAALSLAIRKYAGLAATLLGILLFLFVLLIHVPAIADAPWKPITVGGRSERFRLFRRGCFLCSHPNASKERTW
jgi:hypothetical protein